MLMQLRMLKLSVGKGRQIIKQLCGRVLQSARYVLYRVLVDEGGLHVCLSYLLRNVRVELQAYGRAARSGDPGSCMQDDIL